MRFDGPFYNNTRLVILLPNRDKLGTRLSGTFTRHSVALRHAPSRRHLQKPRLVPKDKGRLDRLRKNSKMKEIVSHLAPNLKFSANYLTTYRL